MVGEKKEEGRENVYILYINMLRAPDIIACNQVLGLVMIFDGNS